MNDVVVFDEVNSFGQWVDATSDIGLYGMGFNMATARFGRQSRVLICPVSSGKSRSHPFLALRGWKHPPDPESTGRYVEFSGDLSPVALTRRRGEQGVLRARKLAGRTRALCALCRAPYPEGLLELAHIKPRTKCTDQEKLDLWNTMLVCGQCHSLFDKGLLWVGGTGTVRWEGGFGPGHPLTVWGEWAAGGQCLEFRSQTRGFFRARLSYSRVLT